MTPPRPAIFLDRDGTLNVEVNYLSAPEQLQLIAGAATAVQQLRAAGYAIIVVTNQSGLARGYLTLDDLRAIHEKLRRELALGGAWVDAIYFCPHHPDDQCECRKPKPGLLLQAAREHDLDLSRSVFIGDAESDLLAAQRAGAHGILVKTGHGLKWLPNISQWTDASPLYIADDLLDAARWLLNSKSKVQSPKTKD